eukprot:7088477-Pyramimonas_sp.AAC.1
MAGVGSYRTQEDPLFIEAGAMQQVHRVGQVVLASRQTSGHWVGKRAERFFCATRREARRDASRDSFFGGEERFRMSHD